MPETDTIPVSASIASTGLGIRYIGDHCYAFGGLTEATEDPTTVISFTSGSGYIVGVFQVNAAYDDDNPAAASIATLGAIKFNGITIAIIGCGGGTPDRRPSSVTQDVIIPPRTQVVCEIDSVTTADRYNSLTFTGRVYGEK